MGAHVGTRHATDTGVLNDSGGPRTMAGVPSAVRTVDAFLASLADDPTDGHHRAPGRIATLLPGEMALALDVVEMALKAADQANDCEERRDARAWLQDRFPLYSARVCFEAIGADKGIEIDYERVRAALAKRWIAREKEQKR